MKKYFLQREISAPNISTKELDEYRNSLIIEMKKLGASENELNLLCDAILQNSILNKRKPEDVAWAILQ